MYRYWAEVLDVIDGDTLKVRVDLGFNIFTVLSVRVRGVNCHEIHGPLAKDPNELARGKAEQAFVQQWVASLPTPGFVVIDTVKVDKYGGRWDAFVYASDVPKSGSLTETLIATGMYKNVIPG